MVPDCPEGNRGNNSHNSSISDEVQETPLSALTIMVNNADRRDDEGRDDEEGHGEYQLQRVWQEGHHPNHLHLGEDGFFCNPVGKGAFLKRLKIFALHWISLLFKKNM